jgi:hypothetical protein
MKPTSLRPWRTPATNDAAGDVVLRKPTTEICGCVL